MTRACTELWSSGFAWKLVNKECGKVSEAVVSRQGKARLGKARQAKSRRIEWADWSSDGGLREKASGRWMGE